MGKLFYLFILCGALYGTARFCSKATDGFTMHSIAHFREGERGSSESIPSVIFNQPFYYLGKGAQCYAFISEDRRYVLKFFRRDHLKVSFLQGILPWTKEKKKRMEQKREKIFTSAAIAFSHLREETGLIYIQLKQTEGSLPQVLLFDKLHIAHSLALADVPFVLQRAASLVPQRMRKWSAQGEKEEAKKGLRELCALIRNRCEKGIFDKDVDFLTNFGFCEEGAIEVDIGRFRWDEREKDPKIIAEELVRVTDPLVKWLLEIDPELAAFLDAERRCAS